MLDTLVCLICSSETRLLDVMLCALLNYFCRKVVQVGKADRVFLLEIYNFVLLMV